MKIGNSCKLQKYTCLNIKPENPPSNSHIIPIKWWRRRLSSNFDFDAESFVISNELLQLLLSIDNIIWIMIRKCNHILFALTSCQHIGKLRCFGSSNLLVFHSYYVVGLFTIFIHFFFTFFCLQFQFFSLKC